MRLTVSALLAVLTPAAMASMPQTAHAQAGAIYTGLLSRTGAAGHDVVAYFSEGKPVAGSSRFTHQWQGATWRFASAANRDAFAAEPTKFAPAYGGHCAWAAAQGYKAKGDPQHWRIVDGRLFLNYNAEIKTRWEQDIPGFIKTGDANWPDVARK
ncbi:MAG: YHS domain-containing (seleno)protein [Bosea sp. (in: a-proteobacteria)]